jgi:molybdopterin synthase sulfur carrier subunit
VPVVWIPALLRDLTGGTDQVTVPGATVRQVIEQIEKRFPGMQERLCDGDRLRPSIVVVVDGAVSRQRMRQVLADTSEVHFLPTIGGG